MAQHRARRRAEPRLPPPASVRARGADRRARDVECGLRPRGGARREGDSRADVHRPHGVGRRAPAAAAPVVALTHVAASLQHMAIEWGVTAARDSRGDGRRGALAVSRSIGGTRRGDRRSRRPRRPHGGHRREHPGLHERDQGGHRLNGRGRAGRAPNVASWQGGPRRRRRARTTSASPADRAPAAPLSVGGRDRRASPSTSTTGPISSYLETRNELAASRADVESLRLVKGELELRLVNSTSVDSIEREARRIGYVRPGERLFVVKGIPAWRRARSSQRLATDHSLRVWTNARSSRASSAARHARSGALSSAARSGCPR